MSLLSNPWLQIGAGLLANSGPSLTPVNPWRGVGQGLMAASEAKAYEAQQAYEQQRMMVEQQKYEQEQQRRAQMQGIIENLPPEQQQLAMANPDAFFKARIDQQFAKPADANLPDGWQMGPDGRAMMIPGYQPEQKPQTSGINLQGPNGEQYTASSVGDANQKLAQGFTYYKPPPSVAVNMGGNEEKPMTLEDRTKLRDANGNYPPPSIRTASEAMNAGFMPTKKSEDDAASATALHLAENMRNFDGELSAIESIPGFDPGSASVAAAGLPGAGAVVPPEAVDYSTAADAWAQHYTYLVSGGAATKDESQGNRNTFFPKASTKTPLTYTLRRKRAMISAYKKASTEGRMSNKEAQVAIDGLKQEISAIEAQKNLPPPPPGAVIDQ